MTKLVTMYVELQRANIPEGLLFVHIRLHDECTPHISNEAVKVFEPPDKISYENTRTQGISATIMERAIIFEESPIRKATPRTSHVIIFSQLSHQVVRNP